MSSASLTKVAVLDDYNGLAPSYTSELCDQLDITIYRDTILPTPDPSALISRLKPFHVLCTMRERTPLPRAVIEALPNLKVILTTAMRNRGIDTEACKEKGVIVAGTPSAEIAQGTPKDFAATVQHTWALILALVDNVPRDHSLVTSGSWLNALPLNTYIGGKTLGVVGLGKLGLGTVRIGKVAFGMKILAWSQNLTQDQADESALSVGIAAGDIQVVDKATLFEQSDIVSLHYILSERSKGIVGRADLEKMKDSAMIVNTSRGPLIDEDALLETLERGRIRGAALDVFDIEPLPLDSRWRTTAWGKEGRSEVVLTPHTGYTFESSIHSWWEATRSNLKRIAVGKEVENQMV